MRRKEREITDPQIIGKILTNSKICRIAIHDKEFPYIVPMNFGYSENALFFHCARTGKKIDLLRKNNKVGFEIEYYEETITGPESCDWTTKYRSIIGKGKVEFIDDFTEKENALDIIMIQHGKLENKYQKSLVDRIFILKLDIIEFTAKQSGDW